jgi:hypothetical protein
MTTLSRSAKSRRARPRISLLEPSEERLAVSKTLIPASRVSCVWRLPPGAAGTAQAERLLDLVLGALRP